MLRGSTYDMDIENEIRAIKERLSQLEARLPSTLVADIEELKFKTNDLVKLAGVPVVNTPTATGYVPLIINGQRKNIMIGS